jgi:putative transposase
MNRFVLRDDQWERIKDLLPGKATDRGVTAKDNRLFLEAVLWIGRTGAPWRDLPAELGNWHTTFTRFARWARAGVWDRLFEAVSSDRDFEEVMLDSTAVRAHQHAAGAKKNTARRLWVALAAASEPKSTASWMRSAIPSDSP